ncbi:Rep family protein [Actinomyces culturomici]|uniref:Rep family protein n=1 Tax=Actinomyces culturomici TaxID=1926276 RepID=UPI000E20AFFC|nr:Rep family protein [Actinomyces culturomici]
MSKQSNNPTLIGLTQQLKSDLWTWADDPHNATALDCDALSLGTYLVERLEAVGCKVEAAYAIIHDKDEQDQWNEVTHQYDRVPKERHVHAVFRFADRKSSASVEQLAGFLGVDPQYVEKPKAGRYAFDNMLAYLVHAKYRDKYQYPAEEVATLRGKNYMDIHAERREVWARGAATIKTKNVNESADYLRDLILEGLVSKEQVMLTDELFTIYSRHKTMMDEAFGAYGQRRAYQAAAKLRQGDFHTTVVFIWGEAGVGKTRIAQDFIARTLGLAKECGETWRVYRAATANPLDDWQGQEVVFLDDLRGSAMEANDWLLLLDPYNASPARARYQNKQEVAPRLIVLTATIPPDQYFFWTRNKGNVDEALDQFIRRLAATVKVQHVDGERAYLVSPVGRLKGTRQAVIADRRIDLRFGALGTVTHSADGACNALAGLLAVASPDMGFEETEGWQAGQDLVLLEGSVVEPEPEPEPEPTAEETTTEQASSAAVSPIDQIEMEKRIAEAKAAEDQRKAEKAERFCLAHEEAAAKKAAFAQDGRLDLAAKVFVRDYYGTPQVVIAEEQPEALTGSPWTI